MAARARLAWELSLPASIRSSQQRGGWNRGGSDIRMGSPAHGPAGVFLYIARHKPASAKMDCWVGPDRLLAYGLWLLAVVNQHL